MKRRRSVPLVGLLLRLYPARFRDRYASEIEESLGGLLRAAGERGRWRWMLVWLRGIADLLKGAVRERLRSGRGKKPAMESSTMGVGEMMGTLVRDIRLAFRKLRKEPLFLLVAAGSLAIGIGANTAVFSAANELLVRPLPGIPNYERVVELGRTDRGSGFDTFSYPDFLDIREEIPSLAAAAAFTIEIMSVSREAEGVRAAGFHVSPAYFEILGATPALGRFFLPEEDIGVGQHFVAVVSHAFWTERLGRDPDVIGSTLYLNRLAYTVVGVTGEGFGGHMIGFQPDVLMPMAQLPVMNGGRNEFDARNASWHMALGLLSEDATLEGLNTELAALAQRLAAAYPGSNETRGFRAVPLGPIPGGGRSGVRLFVTVLIAMVVLILLVTCTNIAGMFLARAVSREREVAVRVALGAGRGAIVQQLTIETLMVFAVGGGAGIAIGLWGVGLLNPDVLPLPVPVRFAIEPDPRVIAFATLVTLVTGLLFGLLPAAGATAVDVVTSIRDEGRGGGRRAGRARRVFAGAQVGLSLVLLVTAGLFMRSLQRAASIDTGFDPTGAYVTYIDLSLEGYAEESGRAFQASLLESLASEAWVSAASLSIDLPLDLSSSGTAVTPQGWDEDDRLATDFNRVSDAYFETLGIPILRGRSFGPADGPDAPRAAIVSERFGAEAWPGEEALGRTFQLRHVDGQVTYEIVGIVKDTKNQLITESPKPFMYLSLRQTYAPGVQVVVRTNPGAGSASARLREALSAADPNMSVGGVASLETYTALGVLPQRLAAGITGALGLVALLLSGLGIYGVVSYAVGRQQREIGIRMALGADRRGVTMRFVRGGLLMALPGIVIGMVVSVAIGQVLQALLLDLSPRDPVAFGAVGVVLLSVVLLATWIPARRAARVDPAESLRQE